jgi:hypothetical protein
VDASPAMSASDFTALQVWLECCREGRVLLELLRGDKEKVSSFRVSPDNLVSRAH